MNNGIINSFENTWASWKERIPEAYLGLFLSESQFGAGNQSRGFDGRRPDTLPNNRGTLWAAVPNTCEPQHTGHV